MKAIYISDDTAYEMEREAFRVGLTRQEYLKRVFKEGRKYGKTHKTRGQACRQAFVMAILISMVVGFYGYEFWDSKTGRSFYASRGMEAYQEDVAQKEANEQKKVLLTTDFDMTSFNLTADKALSEKERRYRAIGTALTDGQIDSAAFSSREEYDDFRGYFYKTFCVNNINAFHNDMQLILNDDGTVVCYYLPKASDEDHVYSTLERKGLYKEIVDCYGVNMEYTDTVEEVNSIIDRIHGKLTYDKEYIYSSLDDAIERGTGVCVHFAACYYVLANVEGIPTRVCGGYYTRDNGTGGLHAWCQSVLPDGTVITVDPTMGSIVKDSDLSKYEELNIIEYLKD